MMTPPAAVLVLAALLVATTQIGPTAQPAGNAYVDVTIDDRFGAPLPGVSVKLTGIVSREAISNDAGFVTFDALPEGRYDVVASMKGLAPSAPRVLEVGAFGVTSVALTLKPYAPTLRVTIACGGFDSSTIKSLAAGAHLVLHVKVTDQQTVENPPRDDEASGDLSTINRVQVLQSLKRSARGPAVGSTVTIQQAGGFFDALRSESSR